MCGRFALTDDEAALMAFLGFSDGVRVVPRYNIAPTQPIAILKQENGARRLDFARWGLVPAWAENPADLSLIINARSEGVLEKPAFKNAMRYRRCVVPASGFYEWRRQGRSKQPFWIRPKDGGSIGFAGLWETWSDRDGSEIDSACIITVAANAAVRPIHDRMPAILSPSEFESWLTEPDPAKAAMLLRPAADHFLEAMAVSDRVNRADADDPGLIAPVVPPKTDLFDF